MQINNTLRKVIPICSMLLALGTVAFQTSEYSSKKEKEQETEKIEIQKVKSDHQVIDLKKS
ncbi:MAG: hypothetical protein ACSHWW_06120 [Nonlabens sp.]|uniref:hypothetical protein n=1 Tax=Nonlabens sp. TaxID=1888209 RepID=UPI003EF364C3